MASKKTTSIEFTPKAKELLQKLTVRDLQKNIVSAGVIVFDRLTADQKQIAIDEANDINNAHLVLNPENDVKKLWKEIQKIARKLRIDIDMPNEI